MERTSLRKTLVRDYLTIDGRSLGLFRLGLALLMLVDLVRRFPHVRDFYTNAGVLPNHTVLWRPQVNRLFSVFFPASLSHEVWILFALCALCYLCLLVGWRTRLFQVLSFLAATSLHNRDVFTENWGSVAMGALMAWTVFLPLGRRFSIDALLASLRARRDETPADLTPERLPPPDERPFVSLACLGVLLQLAVIYWFNFIHKSGVTWQDGTAIHYVLWQERIVTHIGLWGRENLPFQVWYVLSRGTLVVEGSAPFLLMSPVLREWTRAAAILALGGLHLGIALVVNVGVFSGSMVAYYPLLLDGGALAVLQSPRAHARAAPHGLLRRQLRRVLPGRPRPRAHGRPPPPDVGLEPGSLVAAQGRARRPARADDPRRRRARPPLDALRRVRADVRRAAARAAVGVAAPAAGAASARGRRLRRLRAQPHVDLDVVRPRGLRESRRAAAAPRARADRDAARRVGARPAPDGARGRRRPRHDRLRGRPLGGQRLDPAGAALGAPPPVDGGRRHVSAHLPELVDVLARRAAA